MKQSAAATEMSPMPKKVCHVVHIVYRFATGGLENVIVQLINHLPHDEFRHTVLALTEIEPDFVSRIERDDVEYIGLGKPPGQTFWLYRQAFHVLRKLEADVVHSCNLAALELMPIAALARVPLRVHAEHGWDVGELGGENRRYCLLRKLYRPFVHEFVAVATPLHDYLRDRIGVPTDHLHLIPNGVDTGRYRPRRPDELPPADFPFQREAHWVIGMIGRLVPIKNPLMLIEAMKLLVSSGEAGTETLRLAIIGEGPMENEIRDRMRSAGLADRLWLPGVRTDIPEILRALDCFVLPSLSEATSCTLQEAMATGLDIIATHVGGNPDLLENGRYGSLVASGNAEELAQEILRHYHSDRSRDANIMARRSIESRYGLQSVMQNYRALFLKH